MVLSLPEKKENSKVETQKKKNKSSPFFSSREREDHTDGLLGKQKKKNKEKGKWLERGLFSVV